MNFRPDDGDPKLETLRRKCHYKLFLGQDSRLVLAQKLPKFLKADSYLRIWVYEVQHDTFENLRILLVLKPLLRFGYVVFV